MNQHVGELPMLEIHRCQQDSFRQRRAAQMIEVDHFAAGEREGY